MTRVPNGVRRSIDPALAMALTMMLSVVPLARAQPRPADDTVVQTSVPERQASSEGSFRLKVRDEVREWRQKMQAFDERTEANSQRHIDAAETRLRAAWDDTEVEARNVQIATERDWARTKLAYEAASHRMAVAWEKARL